MKFGFDIDDTLINLRQHAFHLYNEKLNENKSIEQFHAIQTVEIHEIFGLNQEQGNAMWTRLMPAIYFTDCPPFEGALTLLNELNDKGHDVFYITSRPKKYCVQTKDWMMAAGFPVADGHFFCGMQDDEKIMTIRDLALDYYFDDKPAVLETLGNTKTAVYIVDQSYNQQVEGQRITSWSDFHKSLKI